MFTILLSRALTTFGAIVCLSVLISGGNAGPSHAGLIAHYSFDNGLTTDDSGNGLSLTNRGATETTGRFGNAAHFDGSSYMFLFGSASNDAVNEGRGAFAVSFWYKTQGSGFQPLVGKNNSEQNEGYASYLDSGVIGADLRDRADGQVTTPRSADDGSAFQHVVYQYVRGPGVRDLQLFLNGVLVSSLFANGNDAPSNAFTIGSRNFGRGGASRGGGNQMLTGQIDEVRVFDDELTPTQISNLYSFNSLDAVVAVPAPGSLALFGLGVVGLCYRTRRKPSH